MLVISYLPLFNPPVQVANCTIDDSIDDFVKVVQVSSDLAIGKGVMWLDDGLGVKVPVLIFDEGDDIFEHLTHWSEGKPEDWFALNVVELGDGKVEFLVSPRFSLSVERHKRQYPDSDVENCKVLFTPLQVRIDKSDQFVDWSSNLNPVMAIGIIDMDYLRLGDPTKLNFKKCVNVIELRLESVYNSLDSSAFLPLFQGDEIIMDYGFIGN